MQLDDDPRLPATTDQPASDATVTEPEVETTEGDQPETDEDQFQTTDEGDQGLEGEDDGQQQPAEDRRRKLSGAERQKRALERLRAENAELRRRVAPVTDVKAEVDKRLGPPPKEEDFPGNYTEYSTELTAYKAAHRMMTQQVRDQAARDQSSRGDRMKELADTHLERVEDFRDIAPDYDDVLRKATFTEVGAHVMEMIFESEQGPAIEYYLAKNPSVAQRLSGMTERQAAREIGRLEQTLSQPSQRTQSRASRQPPIRPLTGGASPPSQEASLNSYIRRKYGDR